MDNPSLTGLYWYQGRVISGNAMAALTDTNQIFNGYFAQSPANNGDSIEFLLNIKPGTYQLFFVGFRYGSGGITDLYFDDVFSASFNFGGGGLNNFSNDKGFTAVNPETKVRFTVNGSTTGAFNIRLTYIYAKKTGT